jgi:hypothetical protein
MLYIIFFVQLVCADVNQWHECMPYKARICDIFGNQCVSTIPFLDSCILYKQPLAGYRIGHQVWVVFGDVVKYWVQRYAAATMKKQFRRGACQSNSKMHMSVDCI